MIHLEEPPPPSDCDAPPLYMDKPPSVPRIAAMVASAAAVTAPLFVPADEFFATCGEEVPYLLKPFLIKQGFVLVSGAPKHGKSWFMGYLAGQCAASRLRVLYVAAEGSREMTRDRLEPFRAPGTDLQISWRKGWLLDDPRSVDRLIEEIKAADANVLFLDPLNQLHNHLRKIGEVPAEVLLSINRIITATACTVVLALHTRKGESHDKNETQGEAQSADIAGSYAWAAAADNIISIKAVPNTDRQPGVVRFYVENPDTRHGAPFARMTATVRPGPYSPDAITFDRPLTKDEETLNRLLPLIPGLPDTITGEELRKAAGIGKGPCDRAVYVGVSNGKISRKIGNKGGLYRPDSDGLSAGRFSARTESASPQESASMEDRRFPE